MEVMEKLNAMESGYRWNLKEVEGLIFEVTSLRKENACLREEVSSPKQKASSLEEENTCLKVENPQKRNRGHSQATKRGGCLSKA